MSTNRANKNRSSSTRSAVKKMRTSEYGRSQGEDEEYNPRILSIQSLSNENLHVIFCHLTHTQKLISRFVCKKWNVNISAILARTSFFTLDSEENLQILLDAKVSWSKIKMNICKGFKFFVLPTNLKNNITTLKLTLVEFSMSECMKFLIGFPNVTIIVINLKYVETDLNSPKNKGMISGQHQIDLRRKFQQFTGRLNSLALKFRFHNHTAFIKFLVEISKFRSSCLYRLIIKEYQPDEVDQEDSSDMEMVDCEQVMTCIYNIINISSKSLMELQINFHSPNIRYKVFPKFISKLCDNVVLKLKTVLIHSDNDYKYPEAERDFLIHQKFLKIHDSSLQNITLPWCSNETLCKNFMKSISISDRIKSLECLRQEHIINEFPREFTKLESLTISPDMLMEDRTWPVTMNKECPPCPSVKRLHIYLQEDESGHDLGLDIFVSIFVNIVELIIDGEDSKTLWNGDIQIIIDKLKQLRSFELNCNCEHSNCNAIEDFGFTGIELQPGQIEDLIKSKRFYLLPEIDINDLEAERIGPPISSLVKLERLKITGTNLTDIGLYFGFQFGPLSRLKHLTIHSISEKVSDWGLYWLGKNNVNLEQFDGQFSETNVTLFGIDVLRKELRLMESTQKFKLLTF